MQADVYFVAGMAIGVSLIHGGPAPRFLSLDLFQAVVDGPENVHVSVNKLPESDLSIGLMKLHQASTLDEVKVIADDLSCLLELAGTLRTMECFADRDAVVDGTSHWLYFGRGRAAFDRFQDDLSVGGVLEGVRKYPNYFRKLLCFEPAQLTASVVAAMLVPQLSELGSNRRNTEDRVLGWCLDYVQDVGDDQMKASLKEILQFTTGCCSIPPLGFMPSTQLHFLHDKDTCGSTDSLSRYPKAHTCSNQFFLPVVYGSFEAFVADIDFDMINGQGFGFA